MAALVWDKVGERLVETGIDKAVLFIQKADGTYDKGIAWNGWTGFDENPEGGDPNDLWADNIKYCSLTGTEKFKGTIKAYMYPDEFEECDGSKEIAPGVFAGQQNRKVFGLCYRSLIASDTEGMDKGYKIHLVYGCKASPSGKSRSTVNDSPDGIEFSWEVDSTPAPFTTKVGGVLPKPTSTIVIDSTKITSEKLTAIENLIYGTDGKDGVGGTESTLPNPDKVIEVLS